MKYFTILCLSLLISCSKEKAVTPERTFPVEVVSAVQMNVPIFIETIGNVSSPQSVEIRPQVGGIIEKAFVEEGQKVKKGDPLFRIDPRTYKAELDQAQATLARDEASLEFAKARLERNKELVEADYLSKITYEEYISQVKVAEGVVAMSKASLEKAKLNLEWSTLRSPVNGKVSLFLIDPGNLVVAYPTNPVATVRQITPIDILFSVTQKEFHEVQKALKNQTLKVLAFLPQAMEKPREGTLKYIDNQINPNTGTIGLKGEVVNEDEFFWPGEFIRVRLELGIKKNAIVIPTEAVVTGQQGFFVYLYNPSTSTVDVKPVKLGQKSDGKVIIEEGLNLEDQVVLKGQINLRPQAKVFLSKL